MSFLIIHVFGNFVADRIALRYDGSGSSKHLLTRPERLPRMNNNQRIYDNIICIYKCVWDIWELFQPVIKWRQQNKYLIGFWRSAQLYLHIIAMTIPGIKKQINWREYVLQLDLDL